MLTIGKLGRGQEAYYLDKVAEGAEDYYSGEGEAEGLWIGDAAEELGLYGKVGPDQLKAMLTARNPIDGEPLLGVRGVPSKGAVPGFDLTFSAPKSVSLLWALGGPVPAAEVSHAHQRSVEAALDYMQREACWTRRGAGGSEFVKGNGYLAAAFRHRSSRAGDPQLHTHVLIANATKGPDGRWTRLYHPAIYAHAKTAGYIYEAQLRHELSQSLGVRWQEVRNGIAEIEGFADSHLREFSTRRTQILEAAGPDASARARQVANLTTRSAKEPGVSGETLRQRWAAKAREIGLHGETIEAALHPGTPAVVRTVLAVEQLDRAVTAGVSHFERRDVIQAVADSLRSGAPGAEVEQIADAFLASEAVISIAETAKGERFTTKRIWELERSALDTAERMRSVGPSPAGELIAARVIHAHPTLKDDQAEMVRRLLVEREGIAVVIGEAGTGKSFAIAAAAEGWARAGIPLNAAAPTWRAANVLRAEGLPATSVAGLLGELDRAEQGGGDALPHGSVLLIDEAGMVDSATLARLIAHADQVEAKLVLIGDPQQLGEIEAGGMFGAIAQRTDPIYLDEVIRHRHDLDREAAKRIRDGRGGEALELYRSQERVIVAPDAQARREAMVRDWQGAFARGQDAVMITKRNVEVERLNQLAREVMRGEGRLGGAEIELGEGRFAAGDQVITRVNDRAQEIYNRERWRVAAVDAEKRTVILDGIDQARRVRVDADYLARTNPHNDAPALQHAYAITTYSAQGTTVDRAYVAVDPSMDKQELYVAASRSREETYLYATPEIQIEREEYAPHSPYLREGIPHIAEASERDRAQIAAHDIALHSELSRLPTEELLGRRSALGEEAGREARVQGFHRELQEKIDLSQRRLDNSIIHREAVAEAPRRERKREMPHAIEREANCREHLELLLAEARRMEPLHKVARAELVTTNQILTERRELAITAVRISPPPYITKELGERPSDLEMRKAWERGVEAIEAYRQEHGVTDRGRALGAEPSRGVEGERAQRLLREVQLNLGREVRLERSKELGRGMEIELG